MKNYPSIKGLTTPVYKIELIVLDFDEAGPDDIAVELEQMRYVHATVTKLKVKDAGEWDDDHPLNYGTTDKSAFFDSLPDPR